MDSLLVTFTVSVFDKSATNSLRRGTILASGAEVKGSISGAANNGVGRSEVSATKALHGCFEGEKEDDVGREK